LNFKENGSAQSQYASFLNWAVGCRP